MNTNIFICNYDLGKTCELFITGVQNLKTRGKSLEIIHLYVITIYIILHNVEGHFSFSFSNNSFKYVTKCLR